jgi:hypothetical protein
MNDITPPVRTATPNADTKICIYESDEFYTVFMNGSYAHSVEKSAPVDPVAWDRVNVFVGGMVKCAEMAERAAADAKAKRDYERRAARLAQKAEREKAEKFFGGNW